MAAKQKILIVDDDANIAELISLYLTKECYETMIVNDGEEALSVFKTFQPNLILLDLMLPGIDGYQVCREIRSKASTPIIMLSAKGEVFDKVLGLELGADDYIIKPFDSKELVARVKAVLRRYQPARQEEPKSSAKIVEYPDLVINQTNYSVLYQGHPVDMPPKELELLYFLASSPNQVFTREQLLDHIWGYEYIGDTRTVDVHIKRLREKIKDHPSWSLSTVCRTGCSFEVNGEETMRHSLDLKFILAYLVFGLLGFLVVATFSSRMTLRYLTEQRAESLYREANYISANFVRSYYSDSPDAPSLATVYSHFQALDTYLNASIWLLNADGTLLVNSEGSYSEESNTVIEEFDPTDMGSSYYMISDFYGLFREETLTVAAPITYNFRPRGYVLIHLPMSILNAERDGLLNATYLTLILIFTLSLMILVAFTFTVYRPLKKITEAARQYAQGNFKYQPEIYGEDEIGQLAATLNYMAHELDETDEYQKKFVANISHDFRSPLTSIKGYVEAMLDGTIPPEMQEKYLNIVLMETERLNKLTSGLLTLNSFDTKKNRLDITDFDINTVIKNTVSSFEGQCRDRHISIELLFDAKEQFVSADMGKIQQVLYNLLDNAIKFSPNDSQITIETTLRHEKVFISVKDQGVGIPRDSMKKIWERFYKTDASRGKDKKGTGLGLSIVKEIITSHGEHINAISTEGVGTEFIFTLPHVHEE